eukprot:TRINITY_DN1398_c0_g3_i1.p1 TRINITY_DN1398_c0_g3~~TRINITY_DN1398_c0_g3_i1.p1  ORF type:complete len:421 (+),score=80.69 TRINITY_DN1398_c0_g3_i1:273-1535(+)
MMQENLTTALNQEQQKLGNKDVLIQQIQVSLQQERDTVKAQGFMIAGLQLAESKASSEVDSLKAQVHDLSRLANEQVEIHRRETMNNKKQLTEELKTTRAEVKRLTKKIESLKTKLETARDMRGRFAAFGNADVGERQKRNRLNKCYDAVMELLAQIGRLYAGTTDYETQEEATTAVMRDILTRSVGKGMPYDPIDWVPLKSKQQMERQTKESIQIYVNDPQRVARAQEKAGNTLGAVNIVLKEVLPEGRGWRPSATKLIAAKRTRTDTMQRVLPIWAWTGEGHFVSFMRLLQLILPYYCAQVEDMGHDWEMLGQGLIEGSAEDKVMNPLIDVDGNAMAEFAISFDGRSRGRATNYLTCTIGSKVKGFHKQWQSREWVFSVCAVAESRVGVFSVRSKGERFSYEHGTELPIVLEGGSKCD